MYQELIFIKLPPEHIVTMKFILESYEGLGIIRTLNAERGRLVIIAPSDSMQTLKGLLKSLKNEIFVEEIDAPPEISSDWLMNEYFSDK
ncbi:MAG: DUF4911 domain-containing protein [Deltaproteobacteria bacterium]|jgi:hypothetical protein|nr:DUF4911 domain-containing protein [Deltaproteobacteria bacterium]